VVDVHGATLAGGGGQRGLACEALTRQSQNQKPWSRPLLVVVVVIEYLRDNDNDNDNEISSTVCSSFAE
jgi:hypothetical protein